MVLDAVQLTKISKLPDYTIGKDYDKILISGMGGSSAGGFLLKDLLEEYRGSSDKPIISTPNTGKVPFKAIEICTSYDAPSFVDEKTLVFVVSYSGNTEETLSQFVQLRKGGAKTISLTSGGKLKDWCIRLGLPYIEVPTGFAPRAAVPYLFIPIVQYVAGEVMKEDIAETVKVLDDLRKSDKDIEEIKTMANFMKGHNIVVYGISGMESVACRAKTQINENGKLTSAWATFPQLCHFDIMGYEDNDLNRDTYVLFLRDEKGENPSMRLRIDTFKDIIQSKVKGTAEIYSVGECKLSRMLSLLFYVDLLSYFLATEDNKIAQKNDNIDELKRVLKEKINLQEQLEKELV